MVAVCGRWKGTEMKQGWDFPEKSCATGQGEYVCVHTISEETIDLIRDSCNRFPTYCIVFNSEFVVVLFKNENPVTEIIFLAVVK